MKAHTSENLVGNGAEGRKEIMFAIITFSIIATVTLVASATTMVVTARDGYRRIPTRQY